MGLTPPAAPAAFRIRMPLPCRHRTVVNPADFADVAAGLASLDVVLPQRGRVYSFITPRGELEITARSISQITIGKLIGLAGVLIAILLVWALGRERSRASGARSLPRGPSPSA